MNERGNHGGADVGEISSLLVFISPQYKRTSVATWQIHKCAPIHRLLPRHPLTRFRAAQVDLAPTLSVLLGLPIPRRSVGQVLVPPLAVMSQQQVLAALTANAEQLRATFDDVCDAPGLREVLHETFYAAQCAPSLFE